MKQCKDCKWWQYWKVNQKEGREIGKCFRYPPKISLCDIDRVRPTTIDGCWCGEFQEKPK